MEKVAKKIEIIQVAEIEYVVKDEKCPMPIRIVKEYRTLDDKIIGIDDPLIKYKAFFEPYKHEKK